ncbi:trace amine-associated receptor 13c-like [Odontesthes bonariensis]|uniref:trace amine-associated receptor 13c-like n=1 Tax=Odontesthes bonariensis TaxID=219752 RepID=UPI003F588291
METRDGADLCFPQLLNSSCRKPTLHWSEAVLLNIVLFSISLVTVALNLLVIISISHFRKLHTPTNILLLSLAVSDFLVGLLLMPLEILRRTSCWLLGDIGCSMYVLLVTFIVSASTGNIILISIDRYVAICDPLHYPTRITETKIKCNVCLCWLWYAAFAIFYTKDDLIQPGRSNSCFGECTHVINYVVGAVDLVLNFIISVTVIIALYMRVFVVAVSQARAMRSHTTDVSFQHSLTLTPRKSELKAARTLGVLIVVYLACFCPFYCYSLVEYNVSSTSYAFFFFLSYCNSFLNPLIYALFYPWFRKALKLTITLQILLPGSCEANIL